MSKVLTHAGDQRQDDGMKKAIFLDRDGVINTTLLKMGKQRAPYSMNEFSFIDGVTEAVSKFKNADFVLIVVTNQPDVARGWVSLESVQELNNHVLEQLGVHDIMVCFHTEKDNCYCRKPRPGMLLEAAHKYSIDLKKSFMVGDRMSDVEAGKRAGCKSILVGQAEADVASIEPDHRCENLLAACQWVLLQS